MKRVILIFFPAFICGAVLISCGSENAVPKEPQEENPVIVPVKSSKCDILKFEDNVHHIIWEIHGTIIIGFYTGGTDLSSITPSVTVSEKASVSPQSGEKMDFSNGKEITYTVTAEDGTEKVYKTQAFAPISSECDILKFVDNVHSIIWEINGTSITGIYPECTDLRSITPSIIVSKRASVSPQSGQMDFSFEKKVTYTVTAEDGTTKDFKAQAKVKPGISSSVIVHGTIESKYDMQVSRSIDTIERYVKLAYIELLSNNKNFESCNYMTLLSDGLGSISDAGKPNIPVISLLIDYPVKASVSLKILGYDEDMIDLSAKGIDKKIIPVQPTVSKSEPPLDKFYVDTITYSKDEYYHAEIAIFEESGILRDIRIGRLEIHPIQYNPIQNKLRILNNLKIQIIFSERNY